MAMLKSKFVVHNTINWNNLNFSRKWQGRNVNSSKGELFKTKYTVLFNTERFDSLKNRFHNFNAANGNVLFSLFIVI